MSPSFSKAVRMADSVLPGSLAGVNGPFSSAFASAAPARACTISFSRSSLAVTSMARRDRNWPGFGRSKR